MSSSLASGATTVVYVAEPDQEKLPKGHKSGDVLMGKITYRKNNRQEEGYVQNKGT